MRINKSFIKALSFFLGTVIGVGIFGLPFVALKAGFFVVVLYFLLAVQITILVHYFYGEVILATKKKHRLPGYVGEYFGRKWKNITFFILALGFFGTLLAYIIIGGEFLNFLLASYFGENLILYTLLFFFAGSYLIFRGIKSISLVELLLLIFLLAIFVVFSIKTLPSIDFSNLKHLDIRFLALPYGIVLFSLWGSAVVPEVKEMFVSQGKDINSVRKELKKLIIWGVCLAAFIYLLFIFIVLGSSGSDTSREAISGLAGVIGENIIKFGFIFGIISCFTSFIAIGLTLKKTFWYDFGLPKNFAWAITCFLPLGLFFLGLRNFIEIIVFIGAVSIGTEAVIIIFLYREFLKKKFSKKFSPFAYLLVGIFILGIIFQIAYFLT